MAFWILSTLFLISQKALVFGPKTPYSNQHSMCLRKLLLQQLVLISLNISALFYIKVGRLNFTTVVVLSQAFKKDGKLYPVTFLSKSLSLVEYNYEIYNNKILAFDSGSLLEHLPRLRCYFQQPYNIKLLFGYQVYFVLYPLVILRLWQVLF